MPEKRNINKGCILQATPFPDNLLQVASSVKKAKGKATKPPVEIIAFRLNINSCTVWSRWLHKRWEIKSKQLSNSAEGADVPITPPKKKC